jgi:hypothetical protein
VKDIRPATRKLDFEKVQPQKWPGFTPPRATALCRCSVAYYCSAAYKYALVSVRRPDMTMPVRRYQMRFSLPPLSRRSRFYSRRDLRQSSKFSIKFGRCLIDLFVAETDHERGRKIIGKPRAATVRLFVRERARVH